MVKLVLFPFWKRVKGDNRNILNSNPYLVAYSLEALLISKMMKLIRSFGDNSNPKQQPVKGVQLANFGRVLFQTGLTFTVSC